MTLELIEKRSERRAGHEGDAEHEGSRQEADREGVNATGVQPGGRSARRLGAGTPQALHETGQAQGRPTPTRFPAPPAPGRWR